MLPAWATVLIALGGAAIGAIAGITGSYFTLRGAQLNIEHSEREAWRTRLIEAAQDCSQNSMTAMIDILRIADTDDPYTEAATASEQLEAGGDTLARSTIQVDLLFGQQSPVSKAGRDLAGSLEVARSLLLTPLEGELSGLRKLIEESTDEAEAAYIEFLRTAYEAIHPAGFGESR